MQASFSRSADAKTVTTMTKRNSKKLAASRSKKTKKMTDNSSSTVSLSSAPGAHRHSYRWRYLQLIKDGLIWLTGKRTRSIRISDSEAANASAAAAKKGKKPVKKKLCFKVGLLRNKSKQSAKNKKRGSMKMKSSYGQRKGFVRGGRRDWKGKSNRTSRPKFASLKRNPKYRLKARGGSGGGKRLTKLGRPKRKAVVGGRRGRIARGVPKRSLARVGPRRGLVAHRRGLASQRRYLARGGGPRSNKARGGSPMRTFSRKPRTSGIVTRSVSRLALSKRTHPLTRPMSPVRELPKPILLN